ncbi:MAG: gliding motility-associated C-terminal domain-containing protein [Bacteroidetes bacterium]|nr:gliding motility-associated C-terminal domain-containing protein [Bacteroidota bacterium]
MKKIFFLLFVFAWASSFSQQGVYKAHYEFIAPQGVSTLAFDKAIQHLALDELRYLDERRTLPIEGTSVSLQLYSAQELYQKYGKPLAPIVAQHSDGVSLKMSADTYLFEVLGANKTQTTNAFYTPKKTITHFEDLIHQDDASNQSWMQTITSDNNESPYLSFSSFSLENQFDVLYIFDGASPSARLIGAYTGGIRPTVVKASGASLTLVYTSDSYQKQDGFTATVGRGPAPLPPSPMGGASCGTANPFCTGTTYDFPNSTGVPSMGQMNCLYSTPNPSWYYLQIANSGNISISIAQYAGTGSTSGSLIDVDFACWGPFTSLAAGCPVVPSSSVDCSYSASATETCTINNAIAGQFYILLLTNFSGQTGHIVFSQTGGTGSTNCNIVNCGVTAANTGPYCTGQTISLNAATTNTTATTYNWTGPNGFTSTSANPIISGATAAMAGTYSVTGTTGGTVTCVATTSVVVNPNVPPVVSSTTICQGNSGVLTASGAATYTWNTGENTASVTKSPASTTIYTVSSGAGACIAQSTATITVLANPTITVNTATICIGQQTATLTANGATSYLWSSGVATNTFAITNGAVSTVTVVPNSTTPYFITGGVGTCTTTATTTVTVNALPTLTTTPGSMCAGGTGTAIGATGANTYSWVPTANLNNPNVANPTASPSATTVYTVSGTDANGCVNNSTALLTINPLPTFTVLAPPVCIGNTLSITVSPATFANYSIPAIPFNTATLPITMAATQAGSTMLSMIVTDANGCVNAGTFTATVNPLPTITATTAPVCIGLSGMLNAAGAGATGSYAWSPATGLSATAGNPVYVTPFNTTPISYTVTGTDANGCSNSGTVSLIVNALPVVSISPDTVKGCVPQCATYTVNSNTPPAANNAYMWTYPNGGTATGISPTVCYKVPGTGNVKVLYTDANGCQNTAWARIITYAIPKAEFDYEPKPVTILAPNVTFQNQSYNVMGGPLTYTWNFGDTLGDASISNQLSPQHLYQNPGPHEVSLIVTSKNGCADTAVRTVVIENDFALYVPNAFTPNGDGKNEVFKAMGEGVSDYVIYIYDRWGNQVFTSKDITEGWNGALHNHGSALQTDVYAWRISIRTADHKGHSYSGTVTLLR